MAIPFTTPNRGAYGHRFDGDAPGIEWAVSAAGAFRTRQALSRRNAVALNTLECGWAEHSPAEFEGFVTGHPIDLIADTPRQISQ